MNGLLRIGSLFTVAWVTLLSSCTDEPHGRTIILQGGAADAYREEFANSLLVGAVPTYLYFPEDRRADSPDRTYQVAQAKLKESIYKITISKRGESNVRTIMVLEEPSPGSGTAHGFKWSKDSKALFIYGRGKPLGHDVMLNMALVYLTDSHTLHAVDLERFLRRRSPQQQKNELDAPTNAAAMP